MKQIRITRDSNGNVKFETVSIDPSENVFFTNLDNQPHWPTLCNNQLGAAPSPNSSQCPVPAPGGKSPPKSYKVDYGCKLHSKEHGVINVFAQLAAINTTLAQATKGTAINSQKVVTGGMSPYAISGQQFEITDANNNVIQSGSGKIGPGLQLSATADNTGISVSGTPTVLGTYNFTFEVNDGMGRNLQQVQYSMKVVP